MLSFKALRCYYLALSYFDNSKWKESLLLFEKAIQQIKFAHSHHELCQNVDKVIYYFITFIIKFFRF